MGAYPAVLVPRRTSSKGGRTVRTHLLEFCLGMLKNSSSYASTVSVLMSSSTLRQAARVLNPSGFVVLALVALVEITAIGVSPGAERSLSCRAGRQNIPTTGCAAIEHCSRHDVLSKDNRHQLRGCLMLWSSGSHSGQPLISEFQPLMV